MHRQDSYIGGLVSKKYLINFINICLVNTTIQASHVSSRHIAVKLFMFFIIKLVALILVSSICVCWYKYDK